jgi:glycerol uptake facilitator-like aquaporin
MIGKTKLVRELVAEFFGSFILVLAAISPVILGFDVLEAGIGVAVLMDAIAVGFVLFVLIETLGPISGCHLNPAVTLAMWVDGNIPAKKAMGYAAVQFAGGLLGMLASHAMFIGHDFFQWAAVSEVTRNGGAFFAEFVGTFVLIVVIFGTIYNKSNQAGLVIGLLVGGFLISTSSTMFANPQVSLARIFTWSMAGIRPLDAIVFIAVQFVAAVLGAYFSKFLFADESQP